MSVEPFRAAWWLPGAHAQTAWGRLVRPKLLLALRREVLETPDGDELVLDHLDQPSGTGLQPVLSGTGPQPVLSGTGLQPVVSGTGLQPVTAASVPGGYAGVPRVVLLHGLEGSSYSVYVQGLLAQIQARGWAATAINFRSCARDPANLQSMLPNRRPRLYHSGETSDLDFVVRTLAGRKPGRPLFAVGVSLGGNALLKWLGENPAQRQVAAAATISVPYDLGAGSRRLESRLGRLYVGWFLKTLAPKAIDIARRFPQTRLDAARIARSRTFREFDDAATAPLHGFRDADDYYRQCSSIYFAGRIAVPTLCLSARDDPFLPAEVLDRFRTAASPCVELLSTRHGGHAGFVCGAWPWRCRFWAEQFAITWLESRLEAVGSFRQPCR